MRIRFVLSILATAIFIIQYQTLEAQTPVNKGQENKPCPDIPRSPFRYAITRNKVTEFIHFPNGPTGKSRGVSVLLDAKSLTEENLKQLFELLSKRFAEPTDLVVSVYTDLEDVLTPEENEVVWVNCTVDVAKLTPEHPWAFYIRSVNSESFSYHTKKPSEAPKEVILR